MNREDFINEQLRSYSFDEKTTLRKYNDLSPLEKYLLDRLYNVSKHANIPTDELIYDTAKNNADEWDDPQGTHVSKHNAKILFQDGAFWMRRVLWENER